MNRACTVPLTDEQLRPLLEAREEITFIGKVAPWQAVERQVERLGFGEFYIVTFTKGRQETKVHIKPWRDAA